MAPLSRRLFLTTALSSAPILRGSLVRAQSDIGVTVKAVGNGTLERDGTAARLQPDVPLHEGDLVRTEADGFAELMLHTATRINLGPLSEIVLDSFIADVGGQITIDGAMVFDRPDDLPPIDLTFRSVFARIGVRGTRFFAGPSQGKFAVFAERGIVSVTAAGETRSLGPGEGVEIGRIDTTTRGLIAGPRAAPGPVIQWGEGRIVAAFASVGL